MEKKQAVMIEKYLAPFVDLVMEKEQEELVFDLLSQAQTVFSETGLATFLSNIAVPKFEKEKALRLFQSGDSILFDNLIEVVIANDRESLFVDLVRAGLIALEQATNRFQVEVKSVDGLSEQQKERLKPIIERKFGIQVRSFKEVKDADLIGGFVISANNKTIDASINGQLQTMKEKLK